MIPAYRSSPTADTLPPIQLDRKTPTFGALKIDDVSLDIRPPSSATNTRLQFLELQDQIRTYKEELRKKDDLVQQLSSMEVKELPGRLGDVGIAAHSARGEVAALQVKVDSLKNKMREADHRAKLQEDANNGLTKERDLLREDNARQATIIEELTGQLLDLERSTEVFETLKARNKHAVETIQDQYKDAQTTIVELQTQLRSLQNAVENLQASKQVAEQNCQSFVNQLSGILTTADAVEPIVAKVTTVLADNANLTKRVASLTDQLASVEFEQKASRETIMRLVAEQNRERAERETVIRSNDQGKKDLDNVMSIKLALETEVSMLNQKLASSQRALEQSTSEVHERDAQLTRMTTADASRTGQIQFSDGTVVDSKGLKAFLESAAQLLTMRDGCRCPQNLNSILERINATNREMAELSEVVRQLKARLQEDRSTDLHRTTMATRDSDLHAMRAESKVVELQERLRDLERELTSTAVVVDGLREDRTNFLRLVQKLSEIMKMDRINADIGFDMIEASLISRVEQLQRLELEAVADQRQALGTLKIKLREMKGQVDSKELHMDLLRRKISSLEERLHGRGDAEREREQISVNNRRLSKELERTHKSVEELREENIALKAQLLEVNSIKIKAVEQEKELKSMEAALEKIERVRQKQAKHIGEMKDEKEKTMKKLKDSSINDHQVVESLTHELQLTRSSLEDCTRKERQLIEFRAVVGRLLGLDLSTLAVPDYDIINRLERLVQAHQSNVYTAHALESVLSDMNQGFRSGSLAACGVTPVARQ